MYDSRYRDVFEDIRPYLAWTPGRPDFWPILKVQNKLGAKDVSHIHYDHGQWLTVGKTNRVH